MDPRAIAALEPWRSLIDDAARRHDIDANWLAAVVLTESSGDPWAIRVERGFWRRYRDGIRRWVRSTPTRNDDRWSKYPDLYAASYGLAQVMLQTAVEAGFEYRYPTELLDPARNLDIAARILSRHLRRTGTWPAALLRYNGGGDPAYPDRVRASLHALGVSDA